MTKVYSKAREQLLQDAAGVMEGWHGGFQGTGNVLTLRLSGGYTTAILSNTCPLHIL